MWKRRKSVHCTSLLHQLGKEERLEEQQSVDCQENIQQEQLPPLQLNRRVSVHPLSHRTTITRREATEQNNLLAGTSYGPSVPKVQPSVENSTPSRQTLCSLNGPWTPSGEVFVGMPTAIERPHFEEFYRDQDFRLTSISGRSSPAGGAVMDEVVERSSNAAEAALLIQSTWRMFTCRKNYLHTLQLVIRLQATIRMHRKRRIHQQMQLACSRIQSMYRMYRARDYFLRIKKSAVTIQFAWRNYVIRRDQQQQLDACKRIQRFVRLRQRYMRSRKYILTTQHVLRLFQGKKLDRSETESMLSEGVLLQLECICTVSARATSTTATTATTTAASAVNIPCTTLTANGTTTAPPTTPSRIPKPVFGSVAKPRTDAPTPKKIISVIREPVRVERPMKASVSPAKGEEHAAIAVEQHTSAVSEPQPISRSPPKSAPVDR